MHSKILVSFIIYLVLAGGASAQGVDGLYGQWRTVRHGALVEIVDCGDGTPCGVLAWVDASISGGNVQDIRNTDLELRGRPLIGLPILWGFLPAREGWSNGRIYNPEDGKVFRAYLRLLSPTQLRVTGCYGPFCRSQVWIRSGNS
jgi:uncharacterized protein (DUF2147 family)